jgi:fibronectin type 3 domain-containing protein
MGSVNYLVRALDTDAGGATRAGQASPTRSIDVGNQPPTVPSFYDNKVTGGGSGTSKVQLWWNASTDPDDALDSYEIYRSGCTSSTLVGSALATATTLTDTAAPKGKVCTYNIRAKDVGGMYSAFSPDYQVST